MKKQILFLGLSLMFLFGMSISTALASDTCPEDSSFDFNSVDISVSSGAVHVTSTSGTIQKMSCVKDWVETTYCSSSCGTSLSVNLASGRYNVKVWTGASWVLFQKEVDVPAGNGNANGNNGNANGNANGNNGNANGNANGNNGNANGNANGNNGGNGGNGLVVCADRVASNTTSCTGAYYGGYLSLNGINPAYRLDNGRFVEYTNGTAELTGRWVNNSDPNRVFNVRISFSGRTTTPPAGSPKDDVCNLNQRTSGFYYYTNVSGTLTGVGSMSGVVLGVRNSGPAFQVGEGANITHNAVAFGASGWLDVTIQRNTNNVPINLIPAIDGEGQFADINILLSGSPTACVTGGGSTTGGSTTGGNTTGGSTTGGSTTGGSTTGSAQVSCPTITGGAGGITVSGNFINKIAYLSASGDQVLCSGTCGANFSASLAAGTYTVKVWYGSAWTVCQQTVTVSGGGTTGGSTTGGSTTGGNTTGGSTTGGNTTGGSTTGGSTTSESTTSTSCFVASNTSLCFGNRENYGGYIIISGRNPYYTIENGVFAQTNNGTASLTGRWVNIANPNMFFDISFQFSGAYRNSSPKAHVCGLPQSTVTSYRNLAGSLIGGGTVAGVVLRATAIGDDFQVGQNGNITNSYDSFGASGWLRLSVVSGSISIEPGDNGQNADININLWDGACSRSRSVTDFNAFKSDRAIDLEWVTNNTFISDHYIVEKSIDGVDFEEMVKVDNETFSLDEEYFQNVDNNPVLGNNYYRLKQVFQDGTFEYSEVRTVRFGIDLKVVATFPNPAQNELFINLKEYAGQQGLITISNQFGAVVEEINLAELPSDLLRLDMSNYANGVYFMQTKIAKSRIISSKIVVSKMY